MQEAWEREEKTNTMRAYIHKDQAFRLHRYIQYQHFWLDCTMLSLLEPALFFKLVFFVCTKVDRFTK